MSRTKKTARSSLAVSPFGGDQLIQFFVWMLVGAVILLAFIIFASLMDDEKEDK
jgi:hypothetical protein